MPAISYTSNSTRLVAEGWRYDAQTREWHRPQEQPRMPVTDLRECVEWDSSTAVLRYHFIDRLRGDSTGEYRTACGVLWRNYNRQDGFKWHGRWDRVENFRYAVVYCNGCDMDAAGYFHDARTSHLRAQHRAETADQRERQSLEGTNHHFCFEGCGNPVAADGDVCTECGYSTCGDCLENYRTDILSEDGICPGCTQARAELQRLARESGPL